jgi:CRISPR-associated protein Cas5h
MQNGIFETKGFVVAGKHRPQDITGEFRIGFDKIPTFQNDDFWNIPERYVDVIYPDYPHSMNVEGDYFEYKMQSGTEKWYLI